MIQAVIFDMDGVLIDSEIVYLKHLHGNLLKKYPHVAIEELYPVVGATTKRTREIIGKAIGAEPESEAFIEYYNGLWDNCAVDYPSILRREVPGLLKELRKRGYALALASTTSRAGIEQVLVSCGIRADFDYVVSGDEFKESKPNPEIYLHTANVLDVPPEKCLVVEDSTYGITAGHRAGMTVAALIDNRFGFDRSLADYCMNGLTELLGILEKLK